MNTNFISEVVVQENNIPKVVRVLMKFNVPIRRYPKFGVWCYLLDAGQDVVVFDSGPKYQSGMPFLMFRKFTRKSNNSERLFYALNEYFPGKTVREILLSHYHYDHSELAPELQYKIKEKFGNTPPIRIHGLDFAGKKRMIKIINGSINRVYKKAGYNKWVFGKPLRDNETIDGTSFIVKHLPGHTHGTIGLISHEYTTIICGWWAKAIEHRGVKLSSYIIDENRKMMHETKHKIDFQNYDYYFYHPVIEQRNLRLRLKRLRKKKKEGE